MERIPETAEASLAAIFDLTKLGMAMAAITKMMATTISNSMSENPFSRTISPLFRQTHRTSRPRGKLGSPLLPPILLAKSGTRGRRVHGSITTRVFERQCPKPYENGKDYDSTHYPGYLPLQG